MVPWPPTLQPTWLLPHLAAHLFSPLNLFLRLVTRGLALRAELEWDWKRTLGTPILSNLFDTMKNTPIPNLWPTNWIYRTFSNGMFWFQNLTTDLVRDVGIFQLTQPMLVNHWDRLSGHGVSSRDRTGWNEEATWRSTWTVDAAKRDVKHSRKPQSNRSQETPTTEKHC